jgi:hypothetical protein
MPLALGRALIALAAAITAVVPVLTDWNETHVFNPRWPPHARFHMATSLGMATILSPVALWLLWRRPHDPAAVTVAALIPIAYWAPFFPAAGLRGAGLEDPGVRLPRLAGLPTNVLGAGATTLSAGLGWYLDRRARSQSGW